MTQRVPGSPDAVATYVFAVCRTLEPAAVAGLPGLDTEAPVRALPFGRLTAVVQAVPAADSTEQAWQARLSDRDELERCARAHHEVVSAAAARSCTVPLPLATLYRSDDAARQALSAETDRFLAAMTRIEDHAEWGVKVYVSSTPAEPGSKQPADRTPAAHTRPAPGAGLAYLERKRGIQQQRERHHEAALRIAEEVDAELRGLAAAFRRLPPHSQEVSGRQRVQVLNATYLVAEKRAQELAVRAQTLRQRTGAGIELSGPWVPYSFVGEV
ncbi:GvpL/GvpF family gas vesicle protein [Streptomyces sp. SYSU K21746]